MTAPPPRRGRRHFPTWLIVGTGVLLIAGLLAWPVVSDALFRGKMTHASCGARQIFITLLNMANDGPPDGDAHLGWPGDLAADQTEPVTDLTSLAARMVKYEYIRESDLYPIFAGCGTPRSARKFRGEDSIYKIYLATSSDLPNVLLIATKNFTFGRGLDKTVKPYGDRGYVVLRKGGDVVVFDRTPSALDKKIHGYMPGHNTPEDPGEETDQNVWTK